MDEDLRFPIGPFELNDGTSREERIAVIRELPEKLREACAGLSPEQLDTPYRPGGWSLRQTVHHVADSHVNAYCRFKLALTETDPTIRPYHEDRWAELPDKDLEIEPSLKIIEGVHAHWTALLEAMSDEDYRRELEHPESGRWRLEDMLGLYAWHSRHHTAHLTTTRERNGW
ncbi:MAG: putative metal-dependent hydrolase [Acidobacteria bacterium]|nr:putative metal-dependent hydrolase [Acidobacteriota bacterium]